ncbi:hypothetical protein [Streptomyces sp. SP18CS02]|uniref:hypothetical protein n=1 Tax=Streptomyces sp. SP18CS02 TaxID=3002531 RepID=UPI002E794A34|nr:hypothetical protein [Streptomyces sp. SP18CS02]MEE1754031.1 hypothetical protein [Streptomyces sp. SP18CS02]
MARTSEDTKGLIPAPRSSPENEPPPARPPRRRAASRLAALLVAALLLAGGGLLWRGQQLAGSPAAQNRALSDTGATSRVVGEVSGALSQVFSYSPQDTETTRQAARRLLGGKAARQYATLFSQVEQRAAEQRLTLTTHVVRAGVTRLTDRDAHLLVFLDQVAERAGKPATTAAAQLSVTAEPHDGHWRIVDITSR